MGLGGWFVSLVTCLVLGLSPAYAQSPEPVTDPKATAKEHFLRGVDLAVREEWDAALVEFLRSRELFPTFVAIKNAALSLRRLKRNEEALAAYEQAIATFGTQISADELAQAKDAIAQLQKLVGEIQLRVSPEGATVLVDGRERGKSPVARTLRVDAGLHAVRVFKEGYLTAESEARVLPGERATIEIALRALSESGVVKISEAGGRALEVVVDGTPIGTTPWEGSLAVGSHVVLLRGEGTLGTPPSPVEVVAGKVTPLSLAARALDVELHIKPVPENALVYLDGVALGIGAWRGRVAAGPHRVEVTAKGFLASRQEVELPTGATRTLDVALDRNLDDPLWRAAFRPFVYAEAHGAFAIGPGLGGEPDAPPLGGFAGVRGGYQLTPRLGLELAVGGIQLVAESTRSQVAIADGDRMLESTDFVDRTRLFGPTLAASASYVVGHAGRLPIAVRATFGGARASARFSGRGSFSDGATTVTIAPEERWPSFWLAYAGLDARVRFKLGRGLGGTLSLEAGVTVYLMLPPDVQREAPDGGRRFADFPASSPSETPLGRTYLPREQAVGPALTVAPGIALRLDL